MPHRKLEFEIGNRTPNCLRHHVWLDVSTFNKCLFTTKQGGFLLILICETSQIFVWRNKAFIFFQKSDIVPEPGAQQHGSPERVQVQHVFPFSVVPQTQKNVSYIPYCA